MHTDVFKFRPEPAQRRESITRENPDKEENDVNNGTNLLRTASKPTVPDKALAPQGPDNNIATKIHDSPAPVPDSPTQSLKSRISSAFSKASSLISRRTKRTVRPTKRYIEEF